MTKGINVWVGVNRNGNMQMDTMKNTRRKCVYACEVKTKYVLPYLEKVGWTVDPYTLTKGHGDE